MNQQSGDSAENIKNPLVSVIIPCYNQGCFLGKAIKSVKEQTYKNIEIIVINDGSTDETAEIAHSLQHVKCINQENQGLASARNRGILESTGQFICFLDADDWLFPNGIEKNLLWLLEDPELAFVSGGHTVVNVHGEIIDDDIVEVEKNHYETLLQYNYIGNPSTVLYSRWITKKIPFDNSIQIKGCEDYDQYLKITRNYPVLHHNGMISVYRKHGENMSDNFPMMLESVLYTLKRQWPYLKNQSEKNALKNGIENWKSKYLTRIFNNFSLKSLKQLSAEEKKILLKYALDILQIAGRKAKISLKKHLFLNKD